MLLETVWLELLNRFPDYVYSVLGIVFIGFVIVSLWYFVKTARGISNSASREDRIWKVTDENKKLKNENKINEQINNQLSKALKNVRELNAEYSQLETSDDDFFEKQSELARKTLNALSINLQTGLSYSYRTAFWIVEDTNFTFMLGSTGFPETHKGNRKLSMESIAGRAYKKGEAQVVKDVLQDDNWENSPNGRHSYKSLVCFPIPYVGVVTVDSQSEFDEYQCDIIYLYSDHFSSLMREMLETIDNKLQKDTQSNPKKEGDSDERQTQ